MAEAAALAFAAAIISEMGIEDSYFHTDNEMLVHYLNGIDCSWMPSWDSKPFTHMFINHTKHKRIQVLKIPRSGNNKAHMLARSAFTNVDFPCNIGFSCTNEDHVNSCPLKLALCNVKWESIPSIAASCC